MHVVTWNINDRAGFVRHRPLAADALAAMSPDLVVVTEYFPAERKKFSQGMHDAFVGRLRDAGLIYSEVTEDAGEVANRLLVASRLPFRSADVELPDFDRQFPANLLALEMPNCGLNIIGLRVPMYKKSPDCIRSWDWIEASARRFYTQPALIIGDFNAAPSSRRSRGGKHFQRLVESGWSHSQVTGPWSYTNGKGSTSRLDHALASPSVQLSDCRYVTSAGDYVLAGEATALSDHAALSIEVEITAAVEACA